MGRSRSYLATQVKSKIGVPNPREGTHDEERPGEREHDKERNGRIERVTIDKVMAEKDLQGGGSPVKKGGHGMEVVQWRERSMRCGGEWGRGREREERDKVRESFEIKIRVGEGAHHEEGSRRKKGA